MSNELEEYKKKVQQVLSNVLKDNAHLSDFEKVLIELELKDRDKGGSVYVNYKYTGMFIRSQSDGKWVALDWYSGTLRDGRWGTLQEARDAYGGYGVGSNVSTCDITKIGNGWPESKL